MKKQLSIEEKQQVLLEVLKGNIGTGVATFGVEKEVAGPLVKKGIIHRDTFRYTGGCILTKQGIEHVNEGK